MRIAVGDEADRLRSRLRLAQGDHARRHHDGADPLGHDRGLQAAVQAQQI